MYFHMMFLGVPVILQADNGKEFKGAILQLVKNHGVKVKNGRTRTPHVQGTCLSLNQLNRSKQPTHVQKFG